MKLKLAIWLILISGLFSCRSARVTPVIQETKSTLAVATESSETVTDYSKADSAVMVGALQVNDLGQVTLQVTAYSPGDNVKPEIKIQDNYIYVKCRVDSAEIYRRYSKLFIQNTDTTSQTSFISAPGVRNTRSREAGFFHRALHTAGYLFLAQILILAGYFIFKLRKLFSIY